MAESSSKSPEGKDETGIERSRAIQGWHPMESLRREIDRLFDDFDWGARFPSFRHSILDAEPFRRRDRMFTSSPAVDIAETEKAYEITAELPGLDGKDIEVKSANGCLTIKGEKQVEKDEKKKDFHLHERRFGAFERVFRLPDGVDADRIEATFKKGVLAVTLPKTPEAQKAEKKITVKVD